MAEALKYLYNKELISKLSKELVKVYPQFNKQAFTSNVFNNEWDDLELKERMSHITRTLHQHLPESYEKSIKMLMQVSSKFPLSFECMFFPQYAEFYGMGNWVLSMEALEEFTKYSSSEFAIRPFIISDEKRAMKQMLIWSNHKNKHVRRLASEGCRPRLPWSIQLKNMVTDPSSILIVLENLKNDDEKYVQKSVANNLNDISKDHPELVIGLASKWQNQSSSVDWIIKHGMRTLLKQGKTEALRLFGFQDPKDIQIDNLTLKKQSISIGEDQFFTFELILNESNKVRLEYGVDFMKSNGKSNCKIFQIKEGIFNAGIHKINRKQNFGHYSTRKIYAGAHSISIIVNGQEKGKIDFELIE